MDILTLESELVGPPHCMLCLPLLILYNFCANHCRWDLWWPPVWGGSYWTASLQYRALLSGARLGRNIGRGDGASEYENHATMILDYLQVK
jgi:hypothetical protein